MKGTRTEPLNFKAKLAIGEDAYITLKIKWKRVSESNNC